MALSNGVDYTLRGHVTVPFQAYKMDSNQDPATVLRYFRTVQ